MRILTTILTLAVTLWAQTGSLNLVIVEGEGAINNIRQRTAREPIVQVVDENNRPVAGVAIVFTMPSTGAGATFPNGALTLTTTTDAQGRAVARGLRPNNAQGNYQIRVTASQGGRTASAVINQANVLGAAAAGAGAGISGKLIAVLVAAGAAAAAGGIYVATSDNGNGGGTTVAPTTISPGAGTVGPPR